MSFTLTPCVMHEYLLDNVLSEIVSMRERVNDPCRIILNKSIKDIENRIEGNVTNVNTVNSILFFFVKISTDITLHNHIQ